MSTEPDERQENGNDDSTSFCERPRICLIDLSDDCARTLKTRGFNCYSGTLGALVEVPNKKPADIHYCLPNFSFPPNLHEYDIVVIDLQNPRQVAYVKEDHIRTQIKEQEQYSLRSVYPQTLFDPRAFSATSLRRMLRPLMEKESILIVFAAGDEKILYDLITLTPYETLITSETHSLYGFYPDIPPHRNVRGKDTSVVIPKDGELKRLLEQHNMEATYSIVFDDPTGWATNDRYFFPRMEAKTGGIVAFARVHEDNRTFFFPHISRKPAFMTDLLEKVLPGVVPSLFPYSTQFVWLHDLQYRLPNEDSLLQKRKKLGEDYEKSLKEIDARIDENYQEYRFLHDLLRQSGPELVRTVQKYLSWLGFDNVVNVDETYPFRGIKQPS